MGGVGGGGRYKSPTPSLSAWNNSEGTLWLQNTPQSCLGAPWRLITIQLLSLPSPASFFSLLQAPIPEALPCKPQELHLHLRANLKERKKRSYTWLVVTFLLPVQEVTAGIRREEGCSSVIAFGSGGLGPAPTIPHLSPHLLPAGGPGSQAPSLLSLSLSKTNLGLSFPTLKMREMD